MIPERTRSLMVQSPTIRKALINLEKSRLITLDPFNYVSFYIKGVESHGVTNVLGVAYDGCHKIRLILSKADLKKAKDSRYKLHHISELNDLYHNSCGLEFIYSWDLRIQFIAQNVMSKDVEIRAKDYKSEQLALIAEMKALDKDLTLAERRNSPVCYKDKGSCFLKAYRGVC